MSETVAGIFGDYLRKGLAVSVVGESNEQVAAVVEEISSNSIWLSLRSRSSDPGFKPNDEVQINYWDEGATIYSWAGSILEVDSTNTQRICLSVEEEVTVRRRKSFRARAKVPFSFTVIEAAEGDLAGESVRESETVNISAGGLLFRGNLPLSVGDRLALTLHLSPSQQVEAAAWVVRAEPTSQEESSVRRIALKFLELTTEEQNSLLNFLKSYYE